VADVHVDEVGEVGVALAEALEPGRGRRHRHRRHQLMYVASGVLMLRVGEERYALPPDRAAWIGGGVAHSVDVRRRAALRTVYVEPAVVTPPTCAVFALPPIGRELMLYAQRFGGGEETVVRRRFLETLALLAMEWAATPLPLMLARPRDEVLRRVDSLLRKNLGRRVTLAEAAKHAGLSTRSLSRRMQRELGEGLRARHARLRVHAAIERLETAQIGELAYDLGFATPSAFAQAFKRLTGETPSAMQKKLRGERGPGVPGPGNGS